METGLVKITDYLLTQSWQIAGCFGQMSGAAFANHTVGDSAARASRAFTDGLIGSDAAFAARRSGCKDG